MYRERKKQGSDIQKVVQVKSICLVDYSDYCEVVTVKLCG